MLAVEELKSFPLDGDAVLEFDVKVEKIGLPDNEDGSRPSVHIEVQATDYAAALVALVQAGEDIRTPDSVILDVFIHQYAGHRGMSEDDLAQLADADPDVWEEIMVNTDYGWEDYESTLSLTYEDDSVEDVSFSISAPNPLVASVALRTATSEGRLAQLANALTAECDD